MAVRRRRHPALETLERDGYDAMTGWRMGKKDSALRVAADRGMNLPVRVVRHAAPRHQLRHQGRPR
jgi:hypothetical protein